MMHTNFNSLLFTELSTRHKVVATHYLPISTKVEKSLSLLERESTVRTELLQQVASLQRSIAYQQQRILSTKPLVKTMLAAAKSDPASAAYVLWSKKRRDCPLLYKGRRRRRGNLFCASGKSCGNIALPFSKFCLSRECCICLYSALYPPLFTLCCVHQIGFALTLGIEA